ncbi:MAG: ribose-phosphate diphosphokinase [Bacillota bacterium]|jgi:ribose-phosphate pyrophosphokinase|nr:ribose-phosphate pyrophosphokinase [Bacillota bacterium]
MYYYDRKLKIFSCTSNIPLAAAIAEKIEIPLGNGQVIRFSDGEVSVRIDESVRGADVYIVQSTCNPCNDNLMELLVMIDALKRASAKRITAVIPYYGYARQDRKTRPRDPITAKLVANLLTVAGSNRVLTIDLHAGAIQGFFDIPVDHMTAVPLLAEHFASKESKDLVIVSPDMGGVTRARDMAQRLGVPIAIIDKRRPQANVAEVMNIIGDVRGKHAVMVDDIIDTAGTIVLGAQALIDHGATKVSACCTHPVFSGPAVERLANSCISEVVVCDTIPLPDNKKLPIMHQCSVASLLADAIVRIHEDLSISTLFDAT